MEIQTSAPQWLSGCVPFIKLETTEERILHVENPGWGAWKSPRGESANGDMPSSESWPDAAFGVLWARSSAVTASKINGVAGVHPQ